MTILDSDPRFEYVDEELKIILQQLGAVIARSLAEFGPREKRLGFALQIFEFEGPAFFWISNADREDMFKALREFMQRERGQ